MYDLPLDVISDHTEWEKPREMAIEWHKKHIFRVHRLPNKTRGLRLSNENLLPGKTYAREV